MTVCIYVSVYSVNIDMINARKNLRMGDVESKKLSVWYSDPHHSASIQGLSAHSNKLNPVITTLVYVTPCL